MGGILSVFACLFIFEAGSFYIAVTVTCYVDQESLELGGLPTSDFQVLGLKVCIHWHSLLWSTFCSLNFSSFPNTLIEDIFTNLSSQPDIIAWCNTNGEKIQADYFLGITNYLTINSAATTELPLSFKQDCRKFGKYKPDTNNVKNTILSTRK